MDRTDVQRRQRTLIIALTGLGAALLVFAVILSQLLARNRVVTIPLASATAGETGAPAPTASLQVHGLSLGDPEAAVTIDVFEDFQCPACKYFTESIETLVVENLVKTGKARYVFHNHPFLDDRLPADMEHESDQAANASLCANEQGRFWDMHHTIFANWDGENGGAFSAVRLQAMAQNIGLDMAAFEACFRANKYAADIQAELDLAQEMGVSGTPSVFVNGQPVGEPGMIATYEEIVQAVEQALDK